MKLGRAKIAAVVVAADVDTNRRRRSTGQSADPKGFLDRFFCAIALMQCAKPFAQNPILILALGLCPALATSTSVQNGFGMGMAATFVLVCSNVIISLFRKVIPDKVRIPCFIVVIATFVTIVQLVLKAYLPALDK